MHYEFAHEIEIYHATNAEQYTALPNLAMRKRIIGIHQSIQRVVYQLKFAVCGIKYPKNLRQSHQTHKLQHEHSKYTHILYSFNITANIFHCFFFSIFGYPEFVVYANEQQKKKIQPRFSAHQEPLKNRMQYLL